MSEKVGEEQLDLTLGRGGDLWRLLASITKHKLLRQVRHHDADRRAVGLESSLDRAECSPDLIAGRGPTPDAAADVLQQEWETRTASREAARRIEAVTEKLKSLPLPASAAGAADTSDLPRPAPASPPDPEALPRASG